MRSLDIERWNRKEHFNFFRQFDDPYFAVTVQFDVTRAYAHSKKHKISFFALYLHACMSALNSIENFRYRIREEEVIIHELIHASATFLRADKTFGCSFINYDPDFDKFYMNYNAEKLRIMNNSDLLPPIDSDACIYCSAMPWINFSGHKEPLLGVKKESVPKLAFGKFEKIGNRLKMPVSIAANHALVDGYHMGLLVESFQKELDSI